MNFLDKWNIFLHMHTLSKILAINRCHPRCQNIGPESLLSHPATSHTNIQRKCTMMPCILYNIDIHRIFSPTQFTVDFLRRLILYLGIAVGKWTLSTCHCFRALLGWGVRALPHPKLQCWCLYSLHRPMSGLLVGFWMLLVFLFILTSASFIILCNLSSGWEGVAGLVVILFSLPSAWNSLILLSSHSYPVTVSL